MVGWPSYSSCSHDLWRWNRVFRNVGTLIQTPGIHSKEEFNRLRLSGYISFIVLPEVHYTACRDVEADNQATCYYKNFLSIHQKTQELNWRSINLPKNRRRGTEIYSDISDKSFHGYGDDSALPTVR